MFSIARSRLALPTQFVFLVLNALGVVAGTIYNVNTPDLYVNNVHHKIGWIATWVVTAQVVMSLLFVYSGRNKKDTIASSERAAFLPPTLHLADNRPSHKYSWSGDSGQGTEPPSPTSASRDASPSSLHRNYDFTKPEEQEPESDDFEDIPVSPVRRRPSWFKNNILDRYMSTRVPKFASQKVITIAEVAYEIIDRTILVLGAIALITGGVTYSGIFRGINIFNGLAHFIKGGIFVFWGILSLGRWLGAWADCGWAWNAKPTRSEVGWKVDIKSAEFVESSVIFVYGCTNVFLEHLAAWGGAWTAQDLEHISITIMFFGTGLTGMLVESKRIRKWLNAHVDLMPPRTGVLSEEARENQEEPLTYSTSTNVLPAITVLLLGIMMGSHHQASMLSTNIHSMWGNLFAGFALCRILTYITMYLSPPRSRYPSRPPTELAASFCLISGGLIFMASTKDVVYFVEQANLMAMFIFTVTMGLTAFIMAYEIFTFALKGWAVRREQRANRL